MSETEKILARAMKNIIEVAAEDGYITEEEQSLIDFAEISLKKLQIELQEAYSDGVISAEEQERLSELKAKIIDTVTDIANYDDIISSDEMAMIMAYLVGIKIPKISNRNLSTT